MHYGSFFIGALVFSALSLLIIVVWIGIEERKRQRLKKPTNKHTSENKTKLPDLVALRALHEAATKGPLSLVGERDYEKRGIKDFMVVAEQVGPDLADPDDADNVYICNVGDSAVDEPNGPPQSMANGRYLIAAWNAVPALCDEVERLRTAEGKVA